MREPFIASARSRLARGPAVRSAVIILLGLLAVGGAPPPSGGDDAILVARIPGTIYGSDQRACGTFDVAALSKPLRNVVVSATGIEAAFSTAPTSQKDVCPKQAASIARIGTVGSSATTVHYQIAAADFPPAGDAVSGTIRVTSPVAKPASVDVSVTLRHAGSPLLWLVSLTAPTFFTSLIGFGAALAGLAIYRRQKRIDQELADQAAFKTYSTEKQADLERFFTGVYRQFSLAYNADANQDTAARQWRRNLRKYLKEKDIWNNIPSTRRQALDRHLAEDSQQSPEAIAKQLARLFTTHETTIAPLHAIRAENKESVNV